MVFDFQLGDRTPKFEAISLQVEILLACDAEFCIAFTVFPAEGRTTAVTLLRS
jgi:hypothetical protein